jgi:hypothetical protein
LNLAIHEAALGAQPEKEITGKTPFFVLRKTAKLEGIDISACQSNAERAQAINEARAKAVTA